MKVSFLCLFLSLIPISIGFRCFGCNGLKPCAKFWNATVEERKSNFSLNCGKSAGCMRGYKYKDFTNDTVLELEILKCHEPYFNSRNESILKMNECTKVNETERTYCICDSGDYCIVGADGKGSKNMPWIYAALFLVFALHSVTAV